MGDPESSMSSVAPKSDDLLAPPDENEEDMTSVMSADQRKALQQAASNTKEAETLERDTAKPPPSAEAVAEAAAVAIPKAPAAPVIEAPAPRAVETPVASPARPAPAAASAHGAPTAGGASPASTGWATWELVAFALLAVAVAAALKM